MNGQLSLLPNVRRSDPPTSHHAAKIDRTVISQQVRRALAEHPAGLTDWEIVEALGLPDRLKPSVVKRRDEAGAIDSGLKRPSPFGVDCIVWRLP